MYTRLSFSHPCLCSLLQFTTDDSEGKNEEMHTKEPIKETDSKVKEREEEYLPLRSDIRPSK